MPAHGPPARRACDVDLLVETYFRGYRVKPGSRALAIARAALERNGIEPLEITTGGGSDANALRAAGFEALLLANGTEANHTSDESVSVEALERDARRLRCDRRRGRDRRRGAN